MSRCPDPERPRTRGAGGFTLIEVIVAIGIMVLVTAALTPQIVVGLRAAGTARDITQAKGVAQATLEQIRNMPYFVGRSAGDYIDVLDTYYRNTTPPTTAATGCGGTSLTALPPLGWTGYVPAGAPASARCAWEPASGAFYRRVVNPVVAPGLGAFAMVVSTRFLSSATPPAPLPPLADYDSQVAGKDAPPSSQVGVTVAVLYATQSGVRYVSTSTQVERSTPITPLLESRSRTTVVAVSSALANGTLLQQQVGVLNLLGELFTGSRVVANAAAGMASTSLGEQAAAASLNLVAPVDQPSATSTKGDISLSDGCVRMCFGKSWVDQASALAGGGLPRAGTPTAPVRAWIEAGSNHDGFRFSNEAAASLDLDASEPLVSLDTKVVGALPVVRSCVPASANGTHAAHLSGTGYLDATSTAVESCGTAQTTAVRLFPTTLKKEGVVRIVLDWASARCRVDRATGTPTASAGYRGRLLYLTPTGAYQSVELGSHLEVDPLTDPSTNLLEREVQGGRKLSDYISSWKSLTKSEMRAATTATTAEASVPGAITIITQPTRGGPSADPTSAISIAVGATSCAVGDRR